MIKLLLLTLMIGANSYALDESISLHLDCKDESVGCIEVMEKGYPVKVVKDPGLVIDKSNLVSGEEQQDEFGRKVIAVRINEDAGKKLEELTKNNLMRTMYMVSNGKVIMAPMIRGTIKDSFQISPGIGNEKELFEEIGWLHKKIKATTIKKTSERRWSIVWTAIITLTILGGSLFYVFRPKKKTA